MFALVQNNLIKIGPREWSYPMFRYYLETNKLDFSLLPFVYKDPIITENWKILPVTELTEPPYNSLFEEYAGPYWTIYENYITGYYNVVNSPIDLIKGHLKEKIAANRYEVEVSGINFTFSDNVTVEIYTDREDRSVYLDALLVMSDTDTIDFKFKNNVFKTVTKLELQAIVAVGSQHIKDVFAWESMKVKEIDNALTIDELKLIELRHPIQIQKEGLNDRSILI